MKLIVGLGNPGEDYKDNRHNVGHMFIDYLNESQKSIKSVKSIKSSVFMNTSGPEVKKYVTRYMLHVTSDLIVVHDDLDIPLGKFKIQQGAGPKLHNGITSIEKALKTKDFLRVRIGIDNRAPEHWIEGERYVLSDFFPEERVLLQETFPNILQRLEKRIVKSKKD